MNTEPDPRVAAALVEHQQFLRAVARSLLTDLDGADDIVQETARRALESPPRHRGNLRGWLGTVTRNLALRFRQREGMRPQREQAARPRSALPSPDRMAEQAETQSHLAAAVAGLAEPYRSTIMLRFFEDLSPREIAERSDVPLQTIHTRIRRGLDQLKGRLDSETPGGRRAWSLALLPLAFGRDGIPVHVPVSSPTWIPAAAAGTAIGLASFGVGWATAPEPQREPARVAASPVEVEEPEPVLREVPEPIEVDYLARINEAVTWKDAREIGRAIAKMPPELGRGIILEAFPAVTNWKYRRHLLDAFLWWGVHPHAAEILEMGVRDPHFRVRHRALDLVGEYLAFQDFSRDYDGFFEWYEAVRNLSLRELVTRSTRLRADDLRTAEAKELRWKLEAFEDGNLLVESLWDAAGFTPRALLRESGIDGLLRSWALDERQTAEVRASSLRLVARVDRSRDLLESAYLPIVERSDGHELEVVRAALQAFGHPACVWAMPRIRAAYAQLPKGAREAWGWTLKKIGDRAVLPDLIALRVLEGPGSDVAEPLREMTGVLFEDAAPDGWWEQWWLEHRPEPVELPLERYR